MEVTLKYQGNYINVTRQALIEDLEERLSEARFQHVLSVEKKILQLAEKYQVDPEKASIVALVHDYAKEIDSQEMLRLAKKYWNNDLLDTATEGIWHGFAAAYLLKTQFACKEQDIIQAVAAHTTGWFEMTSLAKVLYIADYIEDRRDFKGVKKIRKIADQDLDQACYDKIRMTTKHLMKKEEFLFPLQIEVYNEWTKKLHQDQKI